MQTNIIKNLLNPALTDEADKILRSCVHCGFCTATCPTYQIFSDELDGPRGRIYLIKQMLEGQPATKKTLTHLDRCLSCRSCETTCPSAVQYSRLLDIGKYLAEKQIKRSFLSNLARKSLLSLLLSKKLFHLTITAIQPFKSLLPKSIEPKVAIASTKLNWPIEKHRRKVLLLTGCVQNTLAPVIDKQLAHLLNHCAIQTIPIQGCCGALPQHLSAEDKATLIFKKNIDQWTKYIDQGIEAIIMSSSGCGATLKQYQSYLQYDKAYRNKAKVFTNLVVDPVEILEKETAFLSQKKIPHSDLTMAFHAPCTLQHGLGVHTKVENLLTTLGYKLVPVKDAHLCCGSAGSYSIFHPKIAKHLLTNKIAELQAGQAAILATSNIGCLTHLNSQAQQPVKHWLSVVYENLKD